MRTITLSVVVLSSVACAVACSAPPSVPSTSSATPTNVPALAGVATQSLSLAGAGSGLHLSSAPANPSYAANYPLSGLTGMTVTVNAYGDLTAGCEAGGSVACTTLPFFSENTLGSVKVYDAYGKVVMLLPACHNGGGGGGGHGGFGGNGGNDGGFTSSDDAGLDNGNGNNGTGSTGNVDAAVCDPVVSASFSGCALTIDGTECNCSDATCAGNALEACLGAIGAVSNNNGGTTGISDDAGVVFSDDAGIVFSDDAGISDDGGVDNGTGGCSSATLANAQAQFCSTVDAALVAAGSSATLDCSALGTLSFPQATPTAGSNSPTCDALIHQAVVQARAALATCDPLNYVGWVSSAKLQLFKDGVCTVW